MRNETQQRITAFKTCLPKLKERVTAAVLMLIVAATMAVTATFAWISLSSSPEIKNIRTTISANGSLEIALVQNTGTDYPTSGRGDSSATDNNIARANVTWGNLVNLSDPVYGINNIELRPALLNTNDLLNRPLQGAVYGTDGRITALDTDYTFATWNGTEFLASDEKGVRAITAYTLAVSEATAQDVKNKIQRAQQNVSTAIMAVNNYYKNSCITSANMNGLKGVLSVILSAKVKDKLDGTTGTAENIVMEVGDIEKMYNLYSSFVQSMELQKTAYIEIGNFQRYIDNLSNGEEAGSNELTWEEIESKKARFNRNTPDNVSTDGVIQLTGLTKFISDYTQIKKDLASLKNIYEDTKYNGGVHKFGEIDAMVTRLAGTSTATVNGKTIGQIGTSDALDMLNGPEIVLHSGYLFDFEQFAVMSSSRMSVTMTIPIDTSIITSTGLTASLAKSMLSGGIKNAHLTTAATVPCYSESDLAKTANQSVNLVPGEKVATDNYGLAIDLWVRSNADKTYLVLEGEAEKTITNVREIGTDGNGDSVDLYVASVSGPDGSSSVDVYKKNDKWYLNGSDDEVTVNGTPQEKYKQVESVSNYSGVNRIWEGDVTKLIAIDSTTQGGGSCYIFYADTPEDQVRFLKLLEAFNIAFVGQNGKMLASAVLDTENAYAVNGKVTVPLKIKDPITETVLQPVYDEDTGEIVDEVLVSSPVKDKNGNPIYGITELERNKAVMITAIVYLDGTLLKNDDVLAASSIQGQLNLQFGSSQELKPAGNLELEAEKRVISASVDITEIDYATAEDLSVNVTVTVEGDNPANVNAFFQRAINSTQGKRMHTESFTRGEENQWTMHYTFTSPGEYYLREVLLDGVSYNLTEPVHVSITGFAPEHVYWDEAGDDVTIYTASSSYTENIGISFGSGIDIGQSDKVQMLFMGENTGSSVSVKMSYDYMKARWTGKATFGTSDTYVLQYFILNGEYYDLSQYSASFVKRLTLYMGLSAEITSNSPQSEFFTAGQTYAKDIRVEIYDNTGNLMSGLEDAVLTYSRGGSSTNSVSAPLTWDNARNSYTGTLSITRPGSYSFLNITIGNNKITRALSAPSFMLKNPDPVSYNTSSVSRFHGEDNIQFVPLTNDAYIGPIRINNSDTAFISAIVTNSITHEEYEITQSTDSTKKGVIYYSNGVWYINLPTYRLENSDGSYGNAIQDGEWNVKSISLWDVIDTSGQEYTLANKLVWENGVNGYDFSSLSTIVSSTLNIVMNPGTTNLGSLSTPFMTKHNLAEESGMYLTLEDDTGRIIPSDVITDISLNLTYSGNNDTSYGYKVSSEYRPSLYVKLNNQEEGTSRWTASIDPVLQYVGVYTVKNLTVSMTNLTKTIEPGNNGVPASYTVKSQGPENNVKYEVRSGDNSSLGKTNGTVTGMFMQQQTPDIKVITRVTYEDESGIEQTAQYAIIENFGVKLRYTYKNGKTAPNGGGYTWSSSAYESFDANMSKTDTTTNGEVYTANATTLLAGTYGVQGIIMINGSEIPITTSIPDVTAYSMKPTVKVTGVNPPNSETVNIFIPSSSTGTYEDYIWNTENLVEVKNAFKNYQANVYLSVSEGSGYPDYSEPSVTLNISNIGSAFSNASFVVPNASSGGRVTFIFSPSSSSITQKIGSSESKTETLAEGGTCGSDSTTTYSIPHFAGIQTISTISVTGSDGAEYSVPLSDSVTIRQTNEIPPSLSFERTIGYNMPETQISEDGGSFTYVLPTSIGTKTSNMTEAVGDTNNWVQQGSSTTAKYVYLKSYTDKTRKETGCNAKTYYYTENVFAKYTRTTTVYTQTTGTNTYEVIEHLVGWLIDGVEYAPGQTVTVRGQMTAVPIIGEQSRTLVSSETKSATKTTYIDVYDGDETINGKEVQSSAADARSQYNLPSGYTWFNSANKSDSSWVHTTLQETITYN